jgi:hypothetical protein
MTWISRRRNAKPGTLRHAGSDDVDHLTAFVRSREGVEAYLEPRTAVTDSTVVLVAASGEWTRRRVDGPSGAASFAKKHKIPLYEVERVGYPRRMRAWTERNRKP